MLIIWTLLIFPKYSFHSLTWHQLVKLQHIRKCISIEMMIRKLHLHASSLNLVITFTSHIKQDTMWLCVSAGQRGRCLREDRKEWEVMRSTGLMSTVSCYVETYVHKRIPCISYMPGAVMHCRCKLKVHFAAVTNSVSGLRLTLARRRCVCVAAQAANQPG